MTFVVQGLIVQKIITQGYESSLDPGAGDLAGAAVNDSLALVAGGGAHRVDFTGTGTDWTTNAPTITGSTGSLGAITVDSDTTAHANYTPGAGAGATTFTCTSHGGTADLTVVAASTGYSLSGPPGGTEDIASTNFTVTLTPAGSASELSVTVTPAIAPDGTTSAAVVLAARTVNASGTFTVTPTDIGAHDVSTSDNRGLTDPSPLTYTATVATVATLRAQVAGSINADAPTTTATANGASGFMSTGHFSTPQTHRGLIWFNYSGMPPDATVLSAVLKIRVATNLATASHTLNVYRLRQRWVGGSVGTASQATWNAWNPTALKDWTTAGAEDTTDDRFPGSIGSLAITSGTTGQLSITLDAAAVQEIIDGTIHGKGGFLLQASDEAGTTLMRWDGFAVTTVANRPTLEITYAAPSHAITENLVADYRLNDDAPNADTSGNAHTLTPSGSPTSVAGHLQEARHFVAASSQRMVAANNLGINWALSWTVTFWYRLTDNLDFYCAFSCANSYALSGNGGAKIFYHKVDVLDYWVAQLYDDGNGNVPGDPVMSDVVAYSYGNPPVGTWGFVAVRHDHLRRFFQVVGPTTKDSSGHHDSGEWSGQNIPYDGTPNTTTNPFTVGAIRNNDVPAYQEHFNGDLDNMTVHDRWLSDEEIQTTLYNGGDGLELFGTQTLSPPLIDSTAQLFGPTLTVGAVSLLVPLLASTTALYAPTVGDGSAIPFIDGPTRAILTTTGAQQALMTRTGVHTAVLTESGIRAVEMSDSGVRLAEITS